SRLFTTMTHPFLTCGCTCLRVIFGLHAHCRTLQLTAMVLPHSLSAQTHLLEILISV
ncbi:hypothetical protein XENORESO_012924, partial [Xenotaenia resolanae]